MIQEAKIKISSPIGLQIDNLVYNNHGEVHSIRANDFSRFNHPDMGGDYGLYAIPLSPSILEKCGFENIYGETWSNGNVEILGRMPHFKDGYLLLNGEARTHWPCTYYYVHQLQNLYYALTQTELKIQLQP